MSVVVATSFCLLSVLFPQYTVVAVRSSTGTHQLLVAVRSSTGTHQLLVAVRSSTGNTPAAGCCTQQHW